MNEMFILILIFLAGLALGTLFFGGLWLTVRKAVGSTKPALLILGSFVFRIALVLIGFYFIGAGNWQYKAGSCGSPTLQPLRTASH